MTSKTIGVAIVLSVTIIAAVGVITGFFSITTAVGVAVCGILIGTGAARGAFSNPPNSQKRN